MKTWEVGRVLIPLPSQDNKDVGALIKVRKRNHLITDLHSCPHWREGAETSSDI